MCCSLLYLTADYFQDQYGLIALTPSMAVMDLIQYQHKLVIPIVLYIIRHRETITTARSVSDCELRKEH